MEDGNTHFLPGLQEGDGCIPRDRLWRCSEHGLFLHHQLQPHEQIKIDDSTWMRKSGEISAARPVYHG